MITTESAKFLQHYSSNGFFYNELMGENNNLRLHWQTFFESFSRLGHEEILNRNQDMLRLLKENGVTYNIYGDPAGHNRPWKLDLVPFIINKEEWQKIESGLVQRVTLLDLILKDIYGGQQLIKKGLLPMDLIYNHTGFFRQCAGIRQPGKHSLIFYAADIGRSLDGKMWIVNDRTQAPSGSGYALENRMAMARVVPELFNGLKVRRLSAYFNALRSSLSGIAPAMKQDLRIVILTPGPGNETYFEHSYLSSFLGFTLVQGSDLMVKDNFVWLKTLGGLEKVDVILRRIDDVYCDPVELKEDSQLGVPGLLQAVRSGNVSIANPLGSSILENPGIMSFLPNISQYLLGEELIMPSIASWWCGHPKELSYVLEHVQSLVIKRIYKDETSTSVDAGTLSSQQLSELTKHIKAYPYLYVGQEKINFSAAPSLINGNIEARNTLFRSFLVSNNESYTAMSGGLTRTTAKLGSFTISSQFGGISKDTWIISPEPGRVLNVRKETEKNHTGLQHGMLPSHKAENLFWVGRYMERILGNARFLRTVIQFVTDGNRSLTENDNHAKKCLLEALTHYTYTHPGFSEPSGEASFKQPWNELADVLFNVKRTGGLSFSLSFFSMAVYAVRDHWSTDTWRVLRGMEEAWATVVNSSQHGHLRMLQALDNLVTSMVAFTGLNRESISRDQGWIMLDTGRKIEQSLLLINMLDATLVRKNEDQVEYDLLESVLISNESLANYRYKYRAHLELPLVLDLMLFDPNNPRSLIYQLDRLKAYLENLPKTQPDQRMAQHEKLIFEAWTLLKLSDKEQLGVAGYHENTHLSKFLNKMSELLMAIPEVITKTYFKHAQKQKQLFAASNI